MLSSKRGEGTESGTPMSPKKSGSGGGDSDCWRCAGGGEVEVREKGVGEVLRRPVCTASEVLSCESSVSLDASWLKCSSYTLPEIVLIVGET